MGDMLTELDPSSVDPSDLELLQVTTGFVASTWLCK